MTITASVARDAIPIGEFEFVTMPREGESGVDRRN
jgi:hypothetical protein